MIKNEQAFTMVEILAVLVVLGIILAIAVPNYDSLVQRSKINVCAENLVALNHAVGIYHEVEDCYPADQQELLTSGYLDRILRCPVDNEDYVYSNNQFSCSSHQ